MKKPYIDRIISLRKLMGMSQTEVAEWLNIDPSTYNKIESGKNILTVDRAYQLANIFEVPITDIINTDDDEFMELIKSSLNEPAQRYRNAPQLTTITINIGGGDSENTPEAKKFLERLNALFRDDRDKGIDKADYPD